MKQLHTLLCLTFLTASLANANTQQNQEFNDVSKKLNLDQQELSFLIEEKLNETSKKQTNDLKGGPTWVTVGNDVSCDYRTGTTKIQQAITDGNTEIRIAHGTYEENILIDDINVSLLGGYADCAAADNNDYNTTSTSTIIQPASSSGMPAIRVTGNSTRNNITLRNLSIRNGENGGSYAGGGVSFYQADTNVSMQNMSINQNNGKWGGGVAIQSGNTDINMNGVLIGNNDATVGGGLYCIGTDNSVFFENSLGVASILNNRATTNGGGVYATQGCRFTSYVGGLLQGIILNSAAENGGGIYASFDAQINLQGHRWCFTFMGSFICLGNNDNPVNLLSNKADSDNDNNGVGGGVYATGTNTKVTVTNAVVDGNTAFHGGAAYIEDGAEYQTYAQNPKSCWEKGRCNQYINNRASTSNGHGGTFYVKDGGTLSVKTTHMEENQADFGAAFYINGTDAKLDLEGSYIVNNGGGTGYSNTYPVRITSGGEARIDYTTIADNNALSASIHNNQGTLRVFSSIIHEQSSVPAIKNASPVLYANDCLIVNELGDIVGASSVVDDPQFVDRNNNDYHINAALSPALDYCDELVAQHTTTDTDGDARGWDDYIATNNWGPFDVGADESYDNDIIFKDGLE